MSVDNAQARFKSLVEKRDRLSQEQIQLDTRKSVAQTEQEKLLSQLQTEYGVSNLDEAKALLAQLEGEITRELDECEEFLGKFGV